MTDMHESPLSKHVFPSWSLIGLISLLPHAFVADSISHLLAAGILILIAGVYLGFAFNDGRMSRILIEATVAVGFLIFSIWAVLASPILLPIGYLAHAVWDWLHHTPLFEVEMPRWYVPACVIVDVIVGLGLWVIWLSF